MNSSVAGDDEASAVRVAMKKETDRICGFCGKRFASGNALGGHMRIHTRVLNMIKEDADDVKKKLSSGEEEEMTSCSICGKNFWSWKSMFRHMRGHRHPAAAADQVSSASLSSTVSDNVVNNQVQDSDSTDVVGPNNQTADLTNSLSRWSVSSKRGRKLVVAGSVTSLEPRSRFFKKKIRKLSDLEEKSVSCYRQELDNTLRAPKKSYGCSQCHMSFPTYQALGGHVSKHRRQLRGSLNLPEKPSTANSSVGSVTKNNEVTNKNSGTEEEIRKLGDLEEKSISCYRQELDNNLGPTKSYGCSHCHMSFPTHQALGGHVSKHRQLRGSLNLPPEKPLTASSSSIALTKNVNKIMNNNSDSEKFLTASCSDQLELHSAGAEAEHGRKFPLIDLNELPPMEDEEGT